MGGESRGQSLQQPVPLWKDVLSLLIKIGLLGIFFLALFTFVFGIFRNQDAARRLCFAFPSVKEELENLWKNG